MRPEGFEETEGDKQTSEDVRVRESGRLPVAAQEGSLPAFDRI